VQRWLGGGQHVKIQVSEAGEALFCSSNITRMSYEGWNEYAVALRGPVVPTLLASYREIGGSVEDAHLDHLRAVAAADEGGIALDYWFCNPNLLQGATGPLGWSGANLVTDRLVQMIANARSSIAITSLYFKPVEPLMAALVAAGRRGCAWRFTTPIAKRSRPQSLRGSPRPPLPPAVAAGIAVYENRHGEHSKIVLTTALS
jgi:phosphatidylserine/phosphatidylglycerophosphate/cardiolipin synthase-like enzyme